MEDGNKKKEPKKNREQAREKFIVIEMETNDETYDLEQFIRNKESGHSRLSPQSEPQKKKEIIIFDCPGCDKKFNKKEHMISHQETHEIACLMCQKLFNMSNIICVFSSYTSCIHILFVYIILIQIRKLNVFKNTTPCFLW